MKKVRKESTPIPTKTRLDESSYRNAFDRLTHLKKRITQVFDINSPLRSRTQAESAKALLLQFTHQVEALKRENLTSEQKTNLQGLQTPAFKKMIKNGLTRVDRIIEQLMQKRKNIAPEFRQAHAAVMHSNSTNVDELSKQYDLRKKALLEAIEALGEHPKKRLMDLFNEVNTHVNTLYLQQKKRATIQLATAKAYQRVSNMSTMDKLRSIIPRSLRHQINESLQQTSEKGATSAPSFDNQMARIKATIPKDSALTPIIKTAEDIRQKTITNIVFVTGNHDTIQTTNIPISTLAPDPSEQICDLLLANEEVASQEEDAQIVLCSSQQAEALQQLTGHRYPSGATPESVTSEIMQAGDDPTALAHRITILTHEPTNENALRTTQRTTGTLPEHAKDDTTDRAFTFLATYQIADGNVTQQIHTNQQNTRYTPTPPIPERRRAISERSTHSIYEEIPLDDSPKLTSEQKEHIATEFHKLLDVFTKKITQLRDNPKLIQYGTNKLEFESVVKCGHDLILDLNIAKCDFERSGDVTKLLQSCETAFSEERQAVFDSNRTNPWLRPITRLFNDLKTALNQLLFPQATPQTRAKGTFFAPFKTGTETAQKAQELHEGIKDVVKKFER